MLETVIRLADRLHRGRPLIGLAAAVGAGLLGVGLLTDAAGWLGLAGLVVLVWSSFLYSVAHFFAGRDWRAPASGAGLAARLRWRVTVGGAWLAVLGLVALAGLLALFTLRALSSV